MSNVVPLKPLNDADVEKAISVLNTINVKALPENVQSALQQLAVKLLQNTL